MAWYDVSMRSNTLQRSTTGIIQGLSWCIGAVQCSDWLSHTGASDGEIFCAYRRRSQFQPHADMQRGRCLEITSATADKNSLRHVSHASLPVRWYRRVKCYKYHVIMPKSSLGRSMLGFLAGYSTVSFAACAPR